jgi:hypothetical protein
MRWALSVGVRLLIAGKLADPGHGFRADRFADDQSVVDIETPLADLDPLARQASIRLT